MSTKRFYIDCEFAERPSTIELISIAAVRDDGKEFYAENSEFNDANANDWVKTNVLPRLWSRQPDKTPFNMWTREGGVGGLLKHREIGSDLLRFVGTDTPEFFGYYADYDWVALCWLFGPMIELPKGWPMYCRDLKQMSDEMGAPKFESPTEEHHALLDARWNRRMHLYLLNREWETHR